MSDVPPEVLTNILCRLPPEPLLRFRCVSKWWCEMIGSQDFVKMHLNHTIRTKSHMKLLLSRPDYYYLDFDSFYSAGVAGNIQEFDHPLKSNEYGTNVLGFCHGLLLLSNSERATILYNPSTRKHHRLPFTEIEFPGEPGEFGVCQFMVYGLGYDSSNDDYKVVRMVQFFADDEDSFDSEVKVYSLKSDSWRRIRDFPYYLLYKRVRGVFAGNALHWVVCRKPESDTENLIAAFDLGTEEYRLVPQPEFSDKEFHMNVELLDGCLCLICNYVNDHIDIWVMKEYGKAESWTKLMSIAQPTQGSPGPNVIRPFDYLVPKAYSKNGRELLLEQDNEVLLWYDLNKGSVRYDTTIHEHTPSNFLVTEVHFGSLVHLSSSGGNHGRTGKAQEKRKKKKSSKRGDAFLSQGFKLVL